MLTCHRPRSTEWCESELTLRAEGLPPDSAMHTATAVAQFPPPALFQAEAHVEMDASAAPPSSASAVAAVFMGAVGREREREREREVVW